MLNTLINYLRVINLKELNSHLICTNDEYNIGIVEFLFSMDDLAEIDN